MSDVGLRVATSKTEQSRSNRSRRMAIADNSFRSTASESSGWKLARAWASITYLREALTGWFGCELAMLADAAARIHLTLGGEPTAYFNCRVA